MSWRNLIWMIIILCLAALALYLARGRPPRVEPADPAVDDLAGALEAYKVIQTNSYAGLPPDQACRGAIEGMAKRVDKFSVYIPPEQVDSLLRRFDGAVEETGLRIAEEDEHLVVVGPVKGSPAHKAKLFAGLEVLSINGVEADYLTLTEAREMLQAGGDRPVQLQLRDRHGRKSTVALRPARFEIETVTGLVRDRQGRWVHALEAKAGLYYLRIAEFVRRRTPGEFHDAYRRLDEPRGVVLDLRDNPGGHRQAAAEIVDRFLDRGVIVRTVPRRGQGYVHEAHPAGTYPPVRLVLLVNQHTASAAEIVAGALQIHKRAVLVGQPTYGKWCVQSPVDIGYGLGRVYLSTARYFLPERPATTPTTAPAAATAAVAPPDLTAPVGEAGIEPDIPVRLTVKSARHLELLRLGGAVMPPPESRPPGSGSPRRARVDRLKRMILELDSQLAEAVRLLKEEPVSAPRPAGSPSRTTGGGPAAP